MSGGTSGSGEKENGPSCLSWLDGRARWLLAATSIITRQIGMRVAAEVIRLRFVRHMQRSEPVLARRSIDPHIVPITDIMPVFPGL
jgi:hypothetical protein